MKPGEYSARRLRAFIPREGTKIARMQQEIEERFAEEKRVEERDIDVESAGTEELKPQGHTRSQGQ